VQFAQHPIAFGCRRLGSGSLFGVLVHPRVGERDRRVLGEEPEQIGVGRPEGAPVVPAEDDAGADNAAALFERHADHAAQRGPGLRGNMTAGHVAVPGESERRPAGDYRAGHAFGEREDPARPTGDADVSFLAVSAGRLIDAADRTGVAVEQFRAPQQDPLQQRTE
jgi:hypothetical protein